MNLRLLLISFLIWEMIDLLLKQILECITSTETFRRFVPDSSSRQILSNQGSSYAKSTIHATILTFRGMHHLFVLWNAPSIAKMQLLEGDLAQKIYSHHEYWRSESWSVVTSNIILAGYLASDVLHVALQFPDLGGFDTLLHHVIFLTCCWFAGKSRAMPFPFSWLIVGEASTPFLNLRWACIKAKKTDGAFFDVVQKLFAVVFVITRFFVYGAGLGHLFYMIYKLGDNVPTDKFVTWINVTLVTGGFLLNLVWLRKIFSVLKKNRTRKSSDGSPTATVSNSSSQLLQGDGSASEKDE